MSRFVAEVKEWKMIFSAKQLSYKIAGQNKFKVYIDTDLTKKNILDFSEKNTQVLTRLKVEVPG